MFSNALSVSKAYGEVTFTAEFNRDTGRLRLIESGAVVGEWFPPHSWFEIASVAGYSTWGTRPNEQDLFRLLDQHHARRVACAK
jgi:hypothetical protein